VNRLRIKIINFINFRLNLRPLGFYLCGSVVFHATPVGKFSDRLTFKPMRKLFTDSRVVDNSKSYFSDNRIINVANLPISAISFVQNCEDCNTFFGPNPCEMSTPMLF
jgi:hypothetical protein